MVNDRARNLLKFRSILLTTQKTYFFLTSLASPGSLFTLCSFVCILKSSLAATQASYNSVL